MQDTSSDGFYAIAYGGNCVPRVNPCRTDYQTASYISDVVNGAFNVRPRLKQDVAALARAAAVYQTYDPNGPLHT